MYVCCTASPQCQCHYTDVVSLYCLTRHGLSVPRVSVSQSRSVCVKLQALVYDILPSTTAVFSYAIGSRKLSANEQFFVCPQTEVSLLQNNSDKRRRVSQSYSRQQSLP